VWVTSLADPNTLLADAALAPDAAMPEHGHGMTQVPRVEKVEPGHFRVSGMRFHMSGRWEMYLDVVRAGVTERAQATIVLE
jgi:hypothetical protein